jgi:V/A-type H+-transporting ATPase subunit C
MQLPSYPYASARIFALENKLIGRDRVDRMVEASSAEEALKVLAETEYGASISELDGPHDYERLLSHEVQRIYDFFETISPNPDITRLFFLKYDFHNLKVLLKSRYLGRNNEEPLIGAGGTIPLDTLKEAIEERKYQGLPSYMAKAVEEIEEAMDTRMDPRRIGTILDKAMYQHIFDVCEEKKCSFALDYFRMQADLINIRSFLRVRKLDETFEFLKGLLLPSHDMGEDFFLDVMEEPIEDFVLRLRDSKYGQVVVKGVEEYINTGSLSTYERLMDDFLLGFVRAARWNPGGIEPIIGYLLAKENEIRIIRIIMVGKINNMPTDTIRERLRDVYV